MHNQKKFGKTDTRKLNFVTFISLEKATKYCNYSQAYLSLRARQGKLKAVKIGRDWVTKREWIEEYLKRVRKYKQRINKKRRVRFFQKLLQKLLKKKKRCKLWHCIFD